MTEKTVFDICSTMETRDLLHLRETISNILTRRLKVETQDVPNLAILKRMVKKNF